MKKKTLSYCLKIVYIFIYPQCASADQMLSSSFFFEQKSKKKKKAFKFSKIEEKKLKKLSTLLKILEIKKNAFFAIKND